MATYPALPQSVDCKMTVALGRQIVRASNGAVKIRQMYSGSSGKKTFSLTHQYLTTTQKDSIKTFYDSNYLASDIALYWKATNTTYTGLMFSEKDPDYDALQGGFWNVTIELVEA